MAVLHAAAQVSTRPFTRVSCIGSKVAGKRSDNGRELTGAGCELSPPEWRQSRRLVSISFSLCRLLFFPNDATASSFLDKYVKRKKLDPLEAYIPAVVLAQLQIKDLEKNLDEKKPEYGTCRSLLRSGPASSLRVNIRAVAQYASDSGNGEAAFEDVDQCLRALEELDSLLLHALRNEPDAPVETMKAKLGTALKALDSLLQTVPSKVLDRGRAMADIYRSASDLDSVEPDLSDSPDIQQLQSIL